MAYPREEQETTCTYDYLLGEWSVYTCVRKHITKLTRIAEPYWKEEETNDKGETRIIAGKWKLGNSQVRFAKIIELKDKDTDDEEEEDTEIA